MRTRLKIRLRTRLTRGEFFVPDMPLRIRALRDRTILKSALGNEGKKTITQSFLKTEKP